MTCDASHRLIANVGHATALHSVLGGDQSSETDHDADGDAEPDCVDLGSNRDNGNSEPAGDPPRQSGQNSSRAFSAGCPGQV